MNLKEIQEKSLAGFLQQAIATKVQRESDIEWATKDTRIESPKIEKAPKVKLSEVVKYAMRQFRV